jgi:chromosome segregation ATPase
VSAGQEAESRLQKCCDSESDLRSEVAALQVLLSSSSSSFEQERTRLEQLYFSCKAASVDCTNKLLSERAELSSLLESLRCQLDKCKASALEERQRLRNERFDMGCLLAAESEKLAIETEKCAHFELRVRSLEQQLSDFMTMHSHARQDVIESMQEVKLQAESVDI